MSKPTGARRNRGVRGAWKSHGTWVRVAAYQRAEYFAWRARNAIQHGTIPIGNDPVTGMPWQVWDPIAMRYGRVAYVAIAREAIDLARAVGPMPLP